ncbi:uncharacterized protein EV420DRAFT_154850 [Desarmillaria tabescens]|uniref:Protein kinase domain-containing protein n=1 Tax=Armillaria tabescens TaxID=1929756 RepID=A0AA39MLB3_ARMTA|nr:uncharacterized protein EV420DRAFT_154850 [Desarmillaria tabescens]KAK0437914.1 hypothetical protein EV420DRAFT_154850 [Desarmillaria tabescens]
MGRSPAPPPQITGIVPKKTDGPSSTYFTGASFQLHPSEPPPVTENKDPRYQDGAQLLINFEDRLRTAIDRRQPLSSDSLSMSLGERLPCSMRKLAHVWTVHVPAISEAILAAKIFDPAYFSDEHSAYTDPFALLNISVSQEVEAYRRLQDTNVPQFHGHFLMPIPSQGDRTVHVLLMEHIDGKDLRILAPVPKAKDVCAAHKLAIINMALNLNLDAFVRGVYPQDFQPRNVILRRPRHCVEFCDKEDCPVRSEVDLDDVRGVLVDLEKVGLGDPMKKLRNLGYRTKVINKQRRRYLKRWLENEIRHWGQ